MIPVDHDTTAGIGSILNRCGSAAITVVGDLMLDEYVHGRVERISPEAPVPVVRAGTHEYRLGGAANVAQQIAALGSEVTLAGVIGADNEGELLLRLCSDSGLDTRGILSIPQRQTTRKLRVLGQGQQLLRIDWEDDQPLSEVNAGRLLQWVMDRPPPDALILSDYAKGVLTPTVIGALLQKRPRYPGAVVVDPKHQDFTRYRGATLLTPNLQELSLASGRSLDAADTPSIAAAAHALIRSGGFQALVVTLGSRGMLIVLADGSSQLIPATKRAVYDVTGAGDTAAAVLTACLAVGASLVEAAQAANAAAGLAVGEIGAVAVPAPQIADALSGRGPNKLLSRSELEILVRRWRASGQRIVFTNGCFDLLHPGHLSLVNFARSLGDVLVVAINSDAAVRRLKGPSRPLVSQADRAALLSALGAVDAVSVFDEDTPLEVLRCVQPDVLVKGQDYQLHQVVGRELVEATGGRVVLAPLLPEYSTTSLLARARA